jgi:hypothetical protein
VIANPIKRFAMGAINERYPKHNMQTGAVANVAEIV